MKGQRIVLAGGSGFLGRAVARVFMARGAEVVVLTRNPAGSSACGRAVYWDGRSLGPWAAELEGAAAVINFAGKNVNCRYTPAALAEINLSRADSVQVIGAAIRQCARPPLAWVQTGSLAIYGDAGDRLCDESAPCGQGVPVESCLQWERAFAESPTPQTRRVWLRISFVLGRDGGALATMEKLTRCFLGGRVGSGRQYISWIHEADMVRLFELAALDSNMSGIYNATAPNPVRNVEFMRELRRALGRPWSPPTPAWLVPIGCWLMRTEPVLALTGRRGVPQRLSQQGFEFKHSELRAALEQLYREPRLDS